MTLAIRGLDGEVPALRIVFGGLIGLAAAVAVGETIVERDHDACAPSTSGAAR